MIAVIAGSILCRPHMQGLLIPPLTSQLLLFIQELLGRTLRAPIVTSSVIRQVAESMFRRRKETEMLPIVFTLGQRIWKGWSWVISMYQKIAA